MDPQIAEILSKINELITMAETDPRFQPNVLKELTDQRARTEDLIRQYKQNLIDQTERLKRELTDFRGRIESIIDRVNRSS